MHMGHYMEYLPQDITVQCEIKSSMKIAKTLLCENFVICGKNTISK